MNDKNDTTSFAWDSFSKTGKIGYYLFYRALSQFGENDVLDRERNSDKKS